MTWRPGLPVTTTQDQADWQEWKRQRVNAAQRHRRERYRRIDLYPSDAAADIIDAFTGPFAGGDYSSVISGIVEEWAEDYRNKESQSKESSHGN